MGTDVRGEQGGRYEARASTKSRENEIEIMLNGVTLPSFFLVDSGGAFEYFWENTQK